LVSVSLKQIPTLHTA